MSPKSKSTDSVCCAIPSSRDSFDRPYAWPIVLMSTQLAHARRLEGTPDLLACFFERRLGICPSQQCWCGALSVLAELPLHFQRIVRPKMLAAGLRHFAKKFIQLALFRHNKDALSYPVNAAEVAGALTKQI